jgi:uncharacterized protein YoxC
MTKEEMEKTMTFILEQQAHLTATVDRLSMKVDRNAEGIAGLLAIAEIQAAEVRDLTESTRALAERQHESDERGRRTDERLNALINIVERHISEGRDGTPK